jgi:purine-binding chemotaxis protein CheW
MNAPVQFCTFRLNGRLYGIDVRNVQEVLCHAVITPVPLAAHAVSGLFSLRGQIMAVIDLRRCFSMPDRLHGSPFVCLIVNTPDGPVSLLADEIQDVFEPDPADFESVRADDDGLETRRLTGVFKLPHGLLRVLNVSAIMAHVMSHRLENIANDKSTQTDSDLTGR